MAGKGVIHLSQYSAAWLKYMPLCGVRGIVPASVSADIVTCKRCLSKMGKSVAPERRAKSRRRRPSSRSGE